MTSITNLRSTLKSSVVFINGIFETAANTFSVGDPVYGGELSKCGAANIEQTNRAVHAAHVAFQTWRHTSVYERAKILRALADELVTRRSRIAAIECLNTGKPSREAEGDVDDCIATLRYVAGLLDKGDSALPFCIQPDAAALPDPNFSGRVMYEPVGVVAGITPFNFPLMMV